MSLDPENTLVMETTKGPVVIKLRPDLAPNHVERIKSLARGGAYVTPGCTSEACDFRDSLASLQHLGYTIPPQADTGWIGGFFALELFGFQVVKATNADRGGMTRALLEFGRNPRWLGGEIAASLLLHTWSQTLTHHPHVHALVAGGGYTCAVDGAGMAWCWGTTEEGRLGIPGAIGTRPQPASQGTAFGFRALAANRHACGVDAAGAARCWATNDNGQLGDGTTTNRDAPTLVSGGHVFAAP